MALARLETAVAAGFAAFAAGPAAAQPTMGTLELSPWAMFRHADPVVKTIMAGLVLASLVTWTIWFAKTVELRVAIQRARRAIRALQAFDTLDAADRLIGGEADPVARLVRTANVEVQSSEQANRARLRERVSWLLQRIEVAAGRRIGSGMGALATIGATAPFVGLLGTVWGIMNSFIGISNAHTTNLAVVAPGIAEALLATALGLFAAIPAVVIYNAMARAVAGYRMLLGDASALVMRLVSRDREQVAASMAQAAE